MTELLINPGSRIASPEYDGEWQNTEAKARDRAEVWLGKMHAEGMTDVELLDGSEPHDGRWLFTFRHKITGTTAALEMHGIHPADLYERQHVFTPRIYWNGSSCANPALEDFAAPGFKPVRTYAPSPSSTTPTPGKESPLTCEYCDSAPAAYLLVADLAKPAGSRASDIVCKACGEAGIRDAAQISVSRSSVWLFALIPASPSAPSGAGKKE